MFFYRNDACLGKHGQVFCFQIQRATKIEDLSLIASRTTHLQGTQTMLKIASTVGDRENT